MHGTAILAALLSKQRGAHPAVVTLAAAQRDRRLWHCLPGEPVKLAVLLRMSVLMVCLMGFGCLHKAFANILTLPTCRVCSSCPGGPGAAAALPLSPC